GADVLADAIEKLDIPRGNFAQKANLEYSIERCIVDDGQNRHRSRFAGAQCRVDMEVGSIQRIEVHEPSLRRCLACQTNAYFKAMCVRGHLTRKAIGGNTIEFLLIKADVERAHDAIELPRQTRKNVLAEYGQR